MKKIPILLCSLFISTSVCAASSLEGEKSKYPKYEKHNEVDKSSKRHKGYHRSERNKTAADRKKMKKWKENHPDADRRKMKKWKENHPDASFRRDLSDGQRKCLKSLGKCREKCHLPKFSDKQKSCIKKCKGNINHEKLSGEKLKSLKGKCRKRCNLPELGNKQRNCMKGCHKSRKEKCNISKR